MKNNFIYTVLMVLLTVSCRKETESTRPVFGEITESVYASGVIKADGQYNVYVPVNGIIKKILVSAGDSVQAGQEIVWIENQSAALNSENARLLYGLAQDNLSSSSGIINDLENGLKVAKEKMEIDSSLYIRQQRLMADNIGSKVELDQRKLAYISSRAAYESAKDKLELTRNQLKNEIKRAENNLKLSEKQKGDYTIKSEIGGRIYTIDKEIGELVNPQSVIGVIGSANVFIIELQVDEYDIVKIKQGQQVIISMDSYKGQTFEAEISHVDPIMNVNARTFAVKASFVKKPNVLYPNLTTQANIIIRKKKNVMTIPTKYLTDNNKVLIDKDQKQEVVIGLQDYLNTEIISGIDTTQTIYLPKK